MLRQLKSSDKLNFILFVNNKELKFNDFIKGRKLAFISEENNNINGLIYVDRGEKNFLNIISNSKKITYNLLKIFFWNWNKDIYANTSEDNKVGFILKKHSFRIINKIDKTFVLYYDPKEKRLKYGNQHNHKTN
jgi:hypothetical protein